MHAMLEEQMHEALVRAVELAGGQTLFAEKLNGALELLTPARPHAAKPIRQQNVDWWMRRAKKLPAELARAAEVALDGRVTRYEFRPDVFGVSHDAAPLVPQQLELPA
jgi:hypothetical protein